MANKRLQRDGEAEGSCAAEHQEIKKPSCPTEDGGQDCIALLQSLRLWEVVLAADPAVQQFW